MIPSAKRLIMSLRDMGYDFAQAVADVVDNSIEAKATVVAIDIEFDGDDSWLRIADNGHGMKPEELREAMRYGSDRDYAVEDLGKFGLGLKTASMSQCQRLSVASRWNPDRADVAAYTWDLEHIVRTNRWEILPVERNGLGPAIRHPLKDTTGTVVLWERLDRILGYKHPYGEAARRRLSQMCREIEVHLGMVLHKFLNGEVRSRRLKILINGNVIEPWDPFCRSEEKTRILQPIRIPIEYEGVAGEVLIEPYILPPQDDFSSLEAFRAASGPANWNQQQGFYIYRAGRMIQSGGWSNLRAPDEHTKLARVAVSFLPKLDEAFKINVAKMRVQMPQQIRDTVRDAIIPVVKLAREIYDRKPAKNLHGTPHPVTPAAPEKTKGGSQPDIAYPPTTGEPPAPYNSQSTLLTLEQWIELALTEATKEERRVLEQVAQRLSKTLQKLVKS